jgi:hypothetical protein
MSVVIEVPEKLKSLVAPIQAMLDSVSSICLQVPEGESVDYAAIEERISKQLGAIECASHQIMLSSLDVQAERVRIWGFEYRHVGRYESEYKCLAGAVVVMRSLYRKVGERSGATMDAVSLRAGAVADGWLPRTAQAMAHLMAKGTSREAESTGKELLRLPYSRSSFERIGHEVGRLYTQAHVRIEEALIANYVIPEGAKNISVSIDRVAVPMEETLPGKPLKTERTLELEKQRNQYITTS